MAPQLGTVAAIVALMVSTPCLAQSPQTDAREQARIRYTEGQQQFRAGNFEQALVNFRSAYRSQPHPVVLLSIAECHERLGERIKAIDVLRQYLRDRPDAPNREEILQRIEGLQRSRSSP